MNLQFCCDMADGRIRIWHKRKTKSFLLWVAVHAGGAADGEAWWYNGIGNDFLMPIRPMNVDILT